MNTAGWIQIIIYLVILIALVKPMGSFMARVYQGERTFLDPVVGPLERLIYRLMRVNPEQEMDWKVYTFAMLIFSAIGVIFLYALQRLQGILPLDPQKFGSVTPPDLAFNTASSFVTNTNWQNYAGDTTMSFLSQMLGMTVQNFLSAATGMVIVVALIRGFARQSANTIGNFWVDMTRTTLYILLPISVVFTLFLVSQGTIQTLKPFQGVSVLQVTKDANGKPISTQTLAMGPLASQSAIEHLGTNGGGYFNVNSAHPFDSPTPLTDLVLMLSETVIAAALTYTFGKMVGDTRQGWAVLAAMMIILVFLIAGNYASEAAGNPKLTALGVDQTSSAIQPGGNMEGKEVRFGVANSSLYSTVTTVTSTGSVNSMHDSYTPLGGLILLVDMMLGETVLGGVGSGLYGMLVFVIVAVFVAGLMVGRTPEYLGKKIEAYEMKMASFNILIMPILALGFTALAVVLKTGQSSVLNPQAHGFSEILYSFTSQVNNNGSAFAGLNGNTPFYNIAGAIDMLVGRFWMAIPIMALAGSLVQKKKVPAGAGTLATHSLLFIVWLIGVVILVGALNFVPALALGPIVEHLTMLGR
ncbi:MAG: potassium-transporting ATPase subunit KdpA [Anaerolineaceae bacterium]|nr:potassium-transporting ATPase subunit KdpA [Anaerolineaceae bacterium]